MKNKYLITLRTIYGSLTIDDIEAETEQEAVSIAEEQASREIEYFSKVDEVHCYSKKNENS
jgi:hypothetical protein